MLCACDQRSALGIPQPGVHRGVWTADGRCEGPWPPQQNLQAKFSPQPISRASPPTPLPPTSCRRKAGSGKASSNRAPWLETGTTHLRTHASCSKANPTPKPTSLPLLLWGIVCTWHPGPCLQMPPLPGMSPCPREEESKGHGRSQTETGGEREHQRRETRRGRISSRPAGVPAAVRTPVPGPGSLVSVLPHQLTHNGL